MSGDIYEDEGDGLDEVIVTEVITTLRVWRVRACDVRDGVDRIRARNTKRLTFERPERVFTKTETRWTGAALTSKRGKR